ncbi:hypothetical protein SUDANB120_06278 (plasmid) [Streptomyces sp. enrichment culture]|uniref:hypothetical protein n=1 Tax=Streptomyces sp. enrichment culture TaxID=1795815 RepID=UPI003F56FB2F
MAVGRQDRENAETHLVARLRGTWREFDPKAKESLRADGARTLFWDGADSLFWKAVHTVTDPAAALAGGVDVYKEVTADLAAGSAGFLPIAEHRKWLCIGLRPRGGRIAPPSSPPQGEHAKSIPVTTATATAPHSDCGGDPRRGDPDPDSTQDPAPGCTPQPTRPSHDPNPGPNPTPGPGLDSEPAVGPGRRGCRASRSP